MDPPQSVRLRDGEREVEVHGGAAFIKQTLDELPALFARLRGEAPPPSRPASISLPRPPRAAAEEEPVDELDEDLDEEEDAEEPEPPARAARQEKGGHRVRHAAPEARGSSRDRNTAPATAAKTTGSRRTAANGRGSLEDRVFTALERADHPLSVAAIRKQIGGETTGQQIRRILERASDRVVATTERPAAYALR